MRENYVRILLIPIGDRKEDMPYSDRIVKFIHTSNTEFALTRMVRRKTSSSCSHAGERINSRIATKPKMLRTINPHQTPKDMPAGTFVHRIEVL